MSTSSTSILTQEQKNHFLAHGWVKIPGGISPENVKKFVGNAWIRLGYDPNDKSTWVEENIHMPRHREIETKEFVPEVYQAMCMSTCSAPSSVHFGVECVFLKTDQEHAYPFAPNRRTARGRRSTGPYALQSFW